MLGTDVAAQIRRRQRSQRRDFVLEKARGRAAGAASVGDQEGREQRQVFFPQAQEDRLTGAAADDVSEGAANIDADIDRTCCA